MNQKDIYLSDEEFVDVSSDFKPRYTAKDNIVTF